MGHKAEDRIAHREVSEAFLKTDLFFTRGNKPNRGISSTSQRKTTLEGEESCKCCKAKIGAFLINSGRKDIMERMRVVCEDIPSLWTSQNISVYIPELLPCPSLSHFTTGPPSNFFSRESLQRRSNSKFNVFEARFNSSLKYS